MQYKNTTALDSIRIMARVIFALMIRESQSRYGHLKIGYLWVFLEPLLFTIVFVFMFTFKTNLTPPGMSLYLFFITGLTAFTIFRDSLGRTMIAVKSNRQLLTYPQVQLLDLCIARALFELFSHISVFIIIITVIHYANIEPVNIQNVGKLLYATIMLCLLGFSAGILSGAVIPVFASTEFLVRTVLLQPMFFLSGSFFVIDMMPVEIQHFLLLNPVLQLIELFRSAFFQGYESQHVDYTYINVFTLMMLFSGLLFQRALRRFAYQA